MYFAVPADHWVKIKEKGKRDKCLNLAREQKKKTMENEGDSDTNSNFFVRSNPQMFGKGIRRRIETI